MKFSTLSWGCVPLNKYALDLMQLNQFILETHPHGVWYIYFSANLRLCTASLEVNITMRQALQILVWKSQSMSACQVETATQLLCMCSFLDSGRVCLVQPGWCLSRMGKFLLLHQGNLALGWGQWGEGWPPGTELTLIARVGSQSCKSVSWLTWMFVQVLTIVCNIQVIGREKLVCPKAELA